MILVGFSLKCVYFIMVEKNCQIHDAHITGKLIWQAMNFFLPNQTLPRFLPLPSTQRDTTTDTVFLKHTQSRGEGPMKKGEEDNM